MSFLSKNKSSKKEKEPESKGEKEKLDMSEKGWLKPEGQLIVDLYETNSDLVLEAPIAGVKPNDLEIFIEKDLLTIKGKRESSGGDEKRNYFYGECYWGPFSREIILPVEVDNVRAKAEVDNGILTIRIPKLQREKKRKIEIKRNSRPVKNSKSIKKK